MTLLNCLLWVLYGMPFVKANSILVATVNGAGVVFETLYTTAFLVFCKNKKERVSFMFHLTILLVLTPKMFLIKI